MKRDGVTYAPITFSDTFLFSMYFFILNLWCLVPRVLAELAAHLVGGKAHSVLPAGRSLEGCGHIGHKPCGAAVSRRVALRQAAQPRQHRKNHGRAGWVAGENRTVLTERLAVARFPLISTDRMMQKDD